jgi:post-segregation antitoxin (ccd killing protein)
MSIDHRSEALRLAEESHGVLRPNGEGPCEADRLLAEAQVHATLARNEEQAAHHADMRDALRLLRARAYDVRKLVSTHIAKALASREPKRWAAGRELAQALDMADCNMDDAIDARLADDGWDPRSAWKAVSTLQPADDPWLPRPDVTADIPERVRRVLVEMLAAALLSDGDAQGVGQTITFALKHAGADLTSDIEKQISSIALGRDPSEPPF